MLMVPISNQLSVLAVAQPRLVLMGERIAAEDYRL
jgi:hypothetical protein